MALPGAARAALRALPQTGEGCVPMYNTSATIHIMLNPLGRSRHCSAATPPGNRRCCARPAQVLALSHGDVGIKLLLRGQPADTHFAAKA